MLFIRKNRSGQVLIVSALLVALLLLTTAMYVIETTKDVPKADSDTADSFSFYKQASKSTLISALANVTGGGSPTILDTDLSQLKAVLEGRSYQAILCMDYTPLNSGSYDNGFWNWQGNQGHGVASVYVDFTLELSGPSTQLYVTYPLNVTSEIRYTGTFNQTSDTSKTIQLDIQLLNDDKPTLAESFYLEYQNTEGNWAIVDSPSVTSNGDGTYSVVFTVESSSGITSLNVSVLCIDQLGISIGAYYTCMSS